MCIFIEVRNIDSENYSFIERLEYILKEANIDF